MSANTFVLKKFTAQTGSIRYGANAPKDYISYAIEKPEKQGKTSDAQRRANAKYDKAHTRRITLKLNTKTDKDVLAWLDDVPNRQGYIKELVRADIREG